MMDILRIPRLDGGLVTNVSPVGLDPEEGYASKAHNIDFSRIGLPRKRPGIAPVEGVDRLPKDLEEPYSEGPIVGMYDYHNSTTGERYLIASTGEGQRHGTYYWDEENEEWSMIFQGMASAYDGDLCDYLSFWRMTDPPTENLIICNAGMRPRDWDGEETNSIENMPRVGCMEQYRNRVLASGNKDKPYHLHISSVGTYKEWDPQPEDSSAVEIMVGPNDGQPVTGLLNMGEGGVLVGKTESLYGLFGYSRENFAIDMLDASVGSASHQAMVFLRPHAYFVHRQGIYRYEMGGTPERISMSIQDEFDGKVDKDRLHLSTASVYNRMYILSCPRKDEGRIVFVWNAERELWSIWDEPQTTAAGFVRDDEGKIYFPKDRTIYRLVPGQLYDKRETETTPIDAVLTTQPLGVQNPEVEIDFRDLYILTDEGSSTVSVRARGNREVILARHAQLNHDDYTSLRIPVGQTTQFFSVTLENRNMNEDLRPISLSYVLRVKEVR